ncbi:SAM-dependent methyltransferase [Kitasatospora cheerisanensis KCTC 2395]|uniref:SAM-dependent methyltransferase n=1 Tax=Kitasatospora cheerisanensis KCTC 2395 TaxID=1348663 RepID=A0A066Z2Y9_9ACTN|nr:SAM-dependent methyltransferase [Kitasatospora cheerisanensis KCTC 2395]
MDDSLPGLASVGGRYDLILLTAVWMHLDAGQRAAAMATLARLLGEGGRIILSLRHGPVPAGRRMFPVDAAETVALARSHGLVPLHLARREDPRARAGVSWTYLALRAEGETEGEGGGRRGRQSSLPGRRVGDRRRSREQVVRWEAPGARRVDRAASAPITGTAGPAVHRGKDDLRHGS